MTISQSPKIPESIILVICLPTEQPVADPNSVTVITQAPVPQLLGDLVKKKGAARKFYLSLTLEHQLSMEALVDTGADITLMSTQFFEEIQEQVKLTGRTLQLQKCALNIQADSTTGV